MLFRSCSCYFPPVQWSCDLRAQMLCSSDVPVIYFNFSLIFKCCSSKIIALFFKWFDHVISGFKWHVFFIFPYFSALYLLMKFAFQFGACWYSSCGHVISGLEWCPNTCCQNFVPGGHVTHVPSPSHDCRVARHPSCAAENPACPWALLTNAAALQISHFARVFDHISHGFHMYRSWGPRSRFHVVYPVIATTWTVPELRHSPFFILRYLSSTNGWPPLWLTLSFEMSYLSCIP